MIKLFAQEGSLSIIINQLLTTNAVNSYQIKVEFNDDWNDLSKYAIFYQVKGERYYIEIIDGMVNIPASILKIELPVYVGIVGTKENHYKTTNYVKLSIVEGATLDNAIFSPPDTQEDAPSYVLTSDIKIKLIRLNEGVFEYSTDDGKTWQELKGVSSYDELEDKPKINDVELSGNKTAADLGLASINDLNESIEEVRAIAQGKKSSYVASYSTNPAFNSQEDSISLNSFIDNNGNTITANILNIGDSVYIVESDVSDRWCSNISGDLIYLSKLEGEKVPISSISINKTTILPENGNVDITVPIKTSELTNDKNYTTLGEVQDLIFNIPDKKIFAELLEDNNFEGINRFFETVQFDKGIDSDGNISITNAVLKVMDNSQDDTGNAKDYVALFGAKEITLEENGKTYVLKLPKKNGTISLVSDITSEFESALSGKINVLAQSAVNEVYARTEPGVDTGLPFSYSAEGNTIAKRSAYGTLAVETPTQEKDAANKSFVEAQCANIPVGVQISNIPNSTSGLVAEPDFAILIANANNYIIKDGKKYDRSSNREQEDTLTYVYNGYLSNRELQEAIEITVSAKSWVLNSDKLLTDKTIANGKIGGVSIKNDFTDGLEISQTDGNLSIYGALDVDITSRASKRPITPINLNKAVIAALSDDNKQIPTPGQIAAFKAAWGITEALTDIGNECVELMPESATNGTLTDVQWATLSANPTNYIKLNNEYYYSADDGHTEGIVSYTHNGWNGTANQDKSINITTATKAWTLVVGNNTLYRHYIKLAVGDKFVFYDFLSTRSTAYMQNSLPVMPNDVSTSFIIIANSYYSSVNGQVYRSSDGTLKAILHGLYTTDGTNVSYLAINGDAVTLSSDNVVAI